MTPEACMLRIAINKVAALFLWTSLVNRPA